MKLKPKFKKQVEKILNAYFANAICGDHLIHSFVTILMNGHASWHMAVEINKPKIDVKNIMPTDEQFGALGFFELMMQTEKKSIELLKSQSVSNKEFWQNGGSFIIDESSEEQLYVSDLVIYNESKGRYNLGQLIELHNIFTEACVPDNDTLEAAEAALYNAINQGFKFLASLHAAQGEDIMVFTFERRKI